MHTCTLTEDNTPELSSLLQIMCPHWFNSLFCTIPYLQHCLTGSHKETGFPNPSQASPHNFITPTSVACCNVTLDQISMTYHGLSSGHSLSPPQRIQSLRVPLDEIQHWDIKATETISIYTGTYLHTLRRALIYGLSAYMWQRRKIICWSYKQYFYWLS